MYKNPTGEYLAVVQFLKGRSVAEAYSRVDRHKLSEKELSIFLEGNAAGAHEQGAVRLDESDDPAFHPLDLQSFEMAQP